MEGGNMCTCACKSIWHHIVNSPDAPVGLKLKALTRLLAEKGLGNDDLFGIIINPLNSAKVRMRALVQLLKQTPDDYMLYVVVAQVQAPVLLREMALDRLLQRGSARSIIHAVAINPFVPGRLRDKADKAWRSLGP